LANPPNAPHSYRATILPNPGKKWWVSRWRGFNPPYDDIVIAMEPRAEEAIREWAIIENFPARYVYREGLP
jgi:hypothetical protein